MKLRSDTFPSMIPPEDFPVDGGAASSTSVRGPYKRRNKSVLLSVEAEEMRVLTDFLAAFGRYFADRHNPDTSAGVLKAYHAAMRFYGER